MNLLAYFTDMSEGYTEKQIAIRRRLQKTTRHMAAIAAGSVALMSMFNVAYIYAL